jgi:hypothetical protein
LKRAAVLAGIAIAIAGCTVPGEGINPAPVPPADAGSPGSDGGAHDAGARKRTVMQRNPFGNVAETENLLWDGDFEWFSAFSDQYGWLAGSSAATLDFTFKDVRVGAACRSGIKCAGLAKKQLIAGIGVASQGNKIEASFWAHLEMGECPMVKAYLVGWYSKTDPDVLLHATAMIPDAEGWCHYDTIVDARQEKPLLLIQNMTGGDVVIDDAVVKKAPMTTSLLAAHGPLTAEAVAMIEDARAAVAKLRGPHDAPPNEARRAYERWKQR